MAKKIEAVVVCINYGDFLKVTLPSMKNLFDKLVVVTDENDTVTPRVCEFYNVSCIKTNKVYTDMDKPNLPNKAIAINEGLSQLSMDGWVVQLDADIWLPPLTRTILEKLTLDESKIYGIDRLMCNSFKDWFNFIYFNFRPLHEGWIYLHLDNFHLGQRIVQYHGDGYMPIGFFQLWNPKISKVYTYPTLTAGYDRTDVVHLKQFPIGKRSFIPELVCIHLASEEHTMGQNWYGRTSRQFIPDLFKITLVTKILAILLFLPRFILRLIYNFTSFIRNLIKYC